MSVPKPSSYNLITSRQRSVRELFDIIKNILDEEPCFQLKSVQITIKLCKTLMASNMVYLNEDDVMRYAYEHGIT